MYDEELFPAQLEAKNKIFASWQENRIAQFTVGQRGGKTALLCNLVDNVYTSGNIFVVIPDMRQIDNLSFESKTAKVISIGILLKEYKKYKANTESDTQFRRTYGKSVILFDEFEWFTNLNEVKELVHDLHSFGAKIATFTSKGNNPVVFEHDVHNSYKAATWDWNPNIHFANLEEQFKENFEKAARDFGLYESDNQRAKDYLLQLKPENANS